MKKLITLLFYISFILYSQAQDTLQTNWTLLKTSILANQPAEGWATYVDNNGYVYWANNQNNVSLEGYDALLYKLDSNGNELWSSNSVVGGYNAQQGYVVTSTDSVVYYGGRYCTQTTLDINLPYCDMFVASVNPNTGDTNWVFHWDQGYGYDEVDGIVPMSDGIYITGWTYGNGTYWDMAILKLDYNGKKIWQNTWGSSKTDHQDGHIAIDDSMIYVCGAYGVPYYTSVYAGYDGKAILCKFLKADGSFVDSTQWGRDDFWVINFENALGMTSDGTYLYVTGVTTLSASDIQIFVAKYDKNLNRIWYHEWGGSVAESARSIKVNNGYVYVGGTTASYGNGGNDAVLLRYDTQGNFIKYYTWGKSKDESVADIFISGNDLYLTGNTLSYTSSSYTDAYILQANMSVMTDVEEPIYSLNNNFCTLYPNPCNENLFINVNEGLSLVESVSVFNTFGELVLYKEVQNSRKSLNIDLSELSSGLYNVKVLNGNGVFVTKIIKE